MWLHTREGIVDLERLRVDYERFRPIGRIGAGDSVRLRVRFAVRDGRAMSVR